MVRKFSLVLALLIGTAAVANATQTIIVGSHNLLPGTAGQVITILVTSNTQVQGLALNSQIADGGPDAGGSVVGPSLVASILPGIFGANNTGESDVDGGGFGNQIDLKQTSTASNTVLANGTLVTLTIDTTGFTGTSPGDLGPGTWSLRLSDTLNGPTNFGDGVIDASNVITDGSIHITPEPTALVLGLFAAAGLGAVAIRNRRRA